MTFVPSTLAAATITLACATACTAGSPRHFKSEGNVWNIPVEGARGTNAFITEAWVHGKGPYYFAIRFNDVSTIHPALVEELGLWHTVVRSIRLTEDRRGKDVEAQIEFAEIDSLRFGELEIGGVKMVILPNGGTFNGHPVVGVIGADMLSETTIWHLDQDRGLVTVANQKHFQPPPGAQRIPVTLHHTRLFTHAQIQGRETYMHVRFDGPTTIRPDIARELSLAGGGDAPWTAEDVSVGDARASRLVFDTYWSHRRALNPVEGELGAQFWLQYNLTINLHQRAVWLTPRTTP